MAQSIWTELLGADVRFVQGGQYRSRIHWEAPDAFDEAIRQFVFGERSPSAGVDSVPAWSSAS